MSIIKLKGIKFHAFHGVFDEEREKGNTFLVDISIETDTTIAEETDDLSKTVDYGVVYDLVNQEMKKPSKLLENVAHRINAAVLEIISTGKIKTTIYKKNPPITGECKYSSVTLKSKK